MPAAGVPRETSEFIESTAVSVKRDYESPMLHAGILQNPTEQRRDYPFFGSLLTGFPFAGLAVDRSDKLSGKRR